MFVHLLSVLDSSSNCCQQMKVRKKLTCLGRETQIQIQSAPPFLSRLG